MGTGFFFSKVVKRPSGGAYDSHLPIAEVKKIKWNCTFDPPVCLHDVFRDNSATYNPHYIALAFDYS